jgi:hypothetical protein
VIKVKGEFKEPVISDKQWVTDILKRSKQVGCEFCFGNIFMWSPVYGSQITTCQEGFFLCKSTDDKPSYSMPKGGNDIKRCIDFLKSDARNMGHNLEIYAVTETEKQMLESLFPNKFRFHESRNSFDYVYSTSGLASLSGKKYHSKRNHILFFEKNYDWSYEDITADNIVECIEMNRNWEQENKKKNEHEQGTQKEEIAIKRAFENYEELDFKGGLIRANGEVVAYTFGELLNENTFCTHVEKAFAEIRGSYPIINREFAKNTIGSFEFVNREEDLGIEGLRKAKLSYNPEMLVTKYRAVNED